MKDPDVAYVAIVDENGTVLAHSDVGEIGKPVVRPAGFEKLGTEPQIRTYKTKPRGEVIDFAMPLVFSETPVGALYLGFSKQAITDALARAFRRAVVITLAMVVVGVLGAVGAVQPPVAADLPARPRHARHRRGRLQRRRCP